MDITSFLLGYTKGKNGAESGGGSEEESATSIYNRNLAEAMMTRNAAYLA